MFDDRLDASSLSGTALPAWIYTDEAVFEQERRAIFRGPRWSFVGFECEVPKPGDFARKWLGDEAVLLVRDRENHVRVLANRCSHRGMAFCREQRGSVKQFVCPYHGWSFGLNGELKGVPLSRGINGAGGMPDEFSRSDFGLKTFELQTRGGVVFASHGSPAESLPESLGNQLPFFDRVFDGRDLKVLGYLHHRIAANWKLVVENIKDPYHASMLHTFLVSLGLFRADQESSVVIDEGSGHASLTSCASQAHDSRLTEEIPTLISNFSLSDHTLLEPLREYPGPYTVVMQTLWPTLMVQQQTNCLAMRLAVPSSAGWTDLHWTFFGYADEPESTTRRRLRQANLQGPAGLVGVDDWEVLELVQRGLMSDHDFMAPVLQGGSGTESTDHMVTEAAIRAFAQTYFKEMITYA